MAKKQQEVKRIERYFRVSLAPNVPAWCDIAGTVHLSKGQMTSICLPEDFDMRNIRKGVKAGLLLLDQFEKEVIEIIEVEVEDEVVEEKAVEEVPAEQPKKRTRKAKKEVVEENNNIKNEEEE